MKLERNRQCPCGSGQKAKRCCLDRLATLEREVGVAERAAMEAADDALAHDRARFVAGWAEIFLGTGHPLALVFAPGHERLEAALHLICDSGPEGLSCGGEEQRAGELLESAQLRVWRLRSHRGAGLIDATCLVTGERAELESIRPPTGALGEGRVVLARCLPRPGERFALLGAPPVIDAGAQADFEGLLRDLVTNRPGADLGCEHATELLAAAWSWPEDREHTADGQLVVDQFVHYELADPEAALARLRTDPVFEPAGEDPEGATFVFRPRGWEGVERREPPYERGVRWRLFEEESRPMPGLGEVSLDHLDEELTLHTLTPDRLPRAEGELGRVLGGLLGEEISRFSDHPEVERRWQRERVERQRVRRAPRTGSEGTARRSLAQAA